MDFSGLLALGLLFATACTGGGAGDGAPAPISTRPPFSFDYKAVTSVLLAKSDPATGDRWSARLQREGDDPEQWTLNPAGSARPIGDRRAAGGFILHLLDTLRTLHPVAPAPRGGLDSFGLSPPRFAIRFTVPGDGGERQYELRIGSDGRTGSGETGAWSQFLPPDTREEDAQVVLAGGAALQMLDYIRTFDALRLQTLATFTTDDVDEFELKRAGKSLFYAQREGSDWADRARKPLKADITAQLDGLTHGRIRDFIDDPLDPAAALASAIDHEPLVSALLTDRQGHVTSIRIRWETRDSKDAAKKRLLATISSRPNAVFELYPELIRYFEAPKTH
jgi:hypothetical protein